MLQNETAQSLCGEENRECFSHSLLCPYCTQETNPVNEGVKSVWGGSMEIHSNPATTNAIAKCILNDVSETSLSNTDWKCFREQKKSISTIS